MIHYCYKDEETNDVILHMVGCGCCSYEFEAKSDPALADKQLFDMAVNFVEACTLLNKDIEHLIAEAKCAIENKDLF